MTNPIKFLVLFKIINASKYKIYFKRFELGALQKVPVEQPFLEIN